VANKGLKMDAVTEALNKARATAAAVAPVSPTATAVGAPAPRRITADDAMVAGFSVDGWLKVNEFGIFIGEDKSTPLDNLAVALDMGQVRYKYGIKYNGPSGAVYNHTYDRVTATSGVSWVEAILEAKKFDQRAREYLTADLPLIVLDDVMDKKGKEKLIEAGKTLGHTPSTTGFQSFSALLRSLEANGISKESGLIKINLGFTVRTSKNSPKPWGVLDFSDYEPIEQLPWDED
jgi:hypothetical protein